MALRTFQKFPFSFLGLRYCIVTLVQLFILFYPHQDEDTTNDVTTNNHQMVHQQQEDEEFGITSIAISDSPDCAIRAVLLDLNPYGRVPKMETLLGYIDIWSLIKINQFHAFFRIGLSEASTFSYSKRYECTEHSVEISRFFCHSDFT